MNFLEEVRAAMLNKLVRHSLFCGVATRIDYEHIIYPDRAPRPEGVERDSHIVVELTEQNGQIKRPWLNRPSGSLAHVWEVYGAEPISFPAPGSLAASADPPYPDFPLAG